MENILKKIIDKKKEKISLLKKELNINTILKNISSTKNYINFIDKIKSKEKKNEISIIAEIKKASPSAGLLVKNFDPLKIAKTYVENGAQCLSILTEEDFFLGKLEYMKNVKNNFQIPILGKDFYIDTYQIALAKSYGADCILIILSAVDKILAKDLYQAANDLNISSIVEVHSKKEAEIALSFSKSIIGINNRNLKTLDISINNSLILSKILSSHRNPLICESGIHSKEDINIILKKTKIRSFLIGESLLSGDNIGSKLSQFSSINVEN